MTTCLWPCWRCVYYFYIEACASTRVQYHKYYNITDTQKGRCNKTGATAGQHMTKLKGGNLVLSFIKNTCTLKHLVSVYRVPCPSLQVFGQHALE